MAKRRRARKGAAGANVITFILAPVVLVVLVYFFYVMREEYRVQSNYKMIEFIQQHHNLQGDIIDYQNDLRIQDVDTDIRLYVKNKFVIIKFGSIELKWTLEQFIKQENLDALKKIYITAYKDRETGRLRVYYKGKEIQRWVS